MLSDDAAAHPACAQERQPTEHPAFGHVRTCGQCVPDSYYRQLIDRAMPAFGMAVGSTGLCELLVTDTKFGARAVGRQRDGDLGSNAGVLVRWLDIPREDTSSTAVR
jgi:hypothetical protein